MKDEVRYKEYCEKLRTELQRFLIGFVIGAVIGMVAEENLLGPW